MNRKKDDLTVMNYVNMPIEHKLPTDREYDFRIETAFVEFHESAILNGFVIVYDGEIGDYVHRDFTITFHSDYYEDGTHWCDAVIASGVDGFWWNERTNMLYAAGDIDIPVHLNSAKIYGEDTFALKSENEELREKIAALEARISTLENA